MDNTEGAMKLLALALAGMMAVMKGE